MTTAPALAKKMAERGTTEYIVEFIQGYIECVLVNLQETRTGRAHRARVELDYLSEVLQHLSDNLANNESESE